VSLEEDQYWDGVLASDARSTRRRNMGATRQRVVLKTLLGMRWESPWWIADTDTYFRPSGLLVTNAPPGALVSEWLNGVYREIPRGPSPIPLSTFELLAKLDDRPQPSFHTCPPGGRIFIRTTTAAAEPLGPPLELTVWGHYEDHP
jgi:hypothetical protein